MRSRSLWYLCAAFVVGLVAISVFVAWPFNTDDAYIPLRYAANWAHDNQLNWNLNDPTTVEGYSSSLYMFLAFLSFKFSLPPILILKIISILSLLGGAFLIHRISTWLTNGWFGCLSLIFYCGYYGTIWWSISGLETATYVFFVLLSVYFFMKSLEASHAKKLRRLAYCSASVFLAGITRPEGPLIGIVILLYFVYHSLAERRGIKEFARGMIYLAIPFVLFYGGYFVLRYWHFGRIWPNSYYVKTIYSGDPWELIKMFLGTAIIPLIIGLIGLRNHRKRSFLIISYSFIIFMTALLYGVDPIVAHHNRHSLASLALAGMILALALHELYTIRPILSKFAASLIFILLFSLGIMNVAQLKLNAELYKGRMEARVAVANLLNSQKIKTYAIGDAGIIPFLTRKAFVYDYYGLNSKMFTSSEIGNRIEKYAEFLMNQKPDAIILVSYIFNVFRPTDNSQGALYEVVIKDGGYKDMGLNFKGPGDMYNYRIFKRSQKRE